MSESGGVILQLENMVMWEKKEVNIFIINSNKAKYWAPFVNYGSGCSFYFHGPVNLLPIIKRRFFSKVKSNVQESLSRIRTSSIKWRPRNRNRVSLRTKEWLNKSSHGWRVLIWKMIMFFLHWKQNRETCLLLSMTGLS